MSGKYELGPADDGRVITVSAGQQVEAVLPQPGATGYRWVLDPLPDGVELLSEHTEPGPLGLVGSAGQRVIKLLIRDPSVAAQVTARLRREWEPPDAAVQSFSVELRG